MAGVGPGYGEAERTKLIVLEAHRNRLLLNTTATDPLLGKLFGKLLQANARKEGDQVCPNSPFSLLALYLRLEAYLQLCHERSCILRAKGGTKGRHRQLLDLLDQGAPPTKAEYGPERVFPAGADKELRVKLLRLEKRKRSLVEEIVATFLSGSAPHPVCILGEFTGHYYWACAYVPPPPAASTTTDPLLGSDAYLKSAQAQRGCHEHVLPSHASVCRTVDACLADTARALPVDLFGPLFQFVVQTLVIEVLPPFFASVPYTSFVSSFGKPTLRQGDAEEFFYTVTAGMEGFQERLTCKEDEEEFSDSELLDPSESDLEDALRTPSASPRKGEKGSDRRKRKRRLSIYRADDHEIAPLSSSPSSQALAEERRLKKAAKKLEKEREKEKEKEREREREREKEKQRPEKERSLDRSVEKSKGKPKKEKLKLKRMMSNISFRSHTKIVRKGSKEISLAGDCEGEDSPKPVTRRGRGATVSAPRLKASLSAESAENVVHPLLSQSNSSGSEDVGSLSPVLSPLGGVTSVVLPLSGDENSDSEQHPRGRSATVAFKIAAPAKEKTQSLREPKKRRLSGQLSDSSAVLAERADCLAELPDRPPSASPTANSWDSARPTSPRGDPDCGITRASPVPRPLDGDDEAAIEEETVVISIPFEIEVVTSEEVVGEPIDHSSEAGTDLAAEQTARDVMQNSGPGATNEVKTMSNAEQHPPNRHAKPLLEGTEDVVENDTNEMTAMESMAKEAAGEDAATKEAATKEAAREEAAREEAAREEAAREAAAKEAAAKEAAAKEAAAKEAAAKEAAAKEAAARETAAEVVAAKEAAAKEAATMAAEELAAKEAAAKEAAAKEAAAKEAAAKEAVAFAAEELAAKEAAAKEAAAKEEAMEKEAVAKETRTNEPAKFTEKQRRATCSEPDSSRATVSADDPLGKLAVLRMKLKALRSDLQAEKEKRASIASAVITPEMIAAAGAEMNTEISAVANTPEDPPQTKSALGPSRHGRVAMQRPHSFCPSRIPVRTPIASLPEPARTPPQKRSTLGLSAQNPSNGGTAIQLPSSASPPSLPDAPLATEQVDTKKRLRLSTHRNKVALDLVQLHVDIDDAEKQQAPSKKEEALDSAEAQAPEGASPSPKTGKKTLKSTLLRKMK